MIPSSYFASCLTLVAVTTAQPAEDQGTYLGVLVGPLAEALYDQVPQLPRGQGVLVTRVLPDSPAAAADLRRNDILLTYDGQKVRDCEHLAHLIRDDRPGRKFDLGYLRAGREATVSITLARGPALVPGRSPAAAEPRAVAKAGAAPAVSVSATPLDNGRLKVTIEYRPERGDRPRVVTWEGEPADLDGVTRALPERERQLARPALDRLRTLNTPKAPAERRPPS
jgi:hypothetical protein